MANRIYGAIAAITTLAALFLLAGSVLKKELSIQLANTTSSEIIIKEVRLNSQSMHQYSNFPVSPGTDFNRSNVALLLGHHWMLDDLSMELASGEKNINISCKISGAESGELCVLRFDLAATVRDHCYCDSSGDFK